MRATAALYVRTETLGRHFVDIQAKELRQWLRSHGFQPGALYSDCCQGDNRSRPGLRRLLAACKAERIGVLAVTTLDRRAGCDAELLLLLQHLGTLITVLCIRMEDFLGSPGAPLQLDQAGIAGVKRWVNMAMYWSTGSYCSVPADWLGPTQLSPVNGSTLDYNRFMPFTRPAYAMRLSESGNYVLLCETGIRPGGSRCIFALGRVTGQQVVERPRHGGRALPFNYAVEWEYLLELPPEHRKGGIPLPRIREVTGLPMTQTPGGLHRLTAEQYQCLAEELRIRARQIGQGKSQSLGQQAPRLRPDASCERTTGLHYIGQQTRQ